MSERVFTEAQVRVSRWDGSEPGGEFTTTVCHRGWAPGVGVAESPRDGKDGGLEGAHPGPHSPRCGVFDRRPVGGRTDSPPASPVRRLRCPAPPPMTLGVAPETLGPST